jgi:3-oxoacyl-[acyl-carrier protein] reductase
MDLGLKGRVALVTASSAGIGFACAKALAAEGAAVCLSSRSMENLEAAAAKMREQTGAEKIATVACDMRDRAQISALCEQVRSLLGPPDILVNNTGGPKPGGFFDLGPADWEEGYRLLVASTVTLYNELIPSMRARRWGRIVNITSTSSRQPIAGLALSNSFRPGILGLAKTVADEVGRDGVLIASIMPGVTLTSRMRELSESRGGESSIIERLTKRVPLGRAAEPDELGAVAAFLCSDKASFITGSAIAVDGGSIRAL